MKTLIFAIFCLALFACNNQKSLSILNSQTLTTQHYKINPSKDTILKTADGALIEIDKESFSGNNGEVELVVKEAYSMEDIIKAGLTTKSDGKPLSSGGMIFLDAIDDKTEIAKQIKVSLPTNNYDVEMQLYKGEEKGDEINWVQPTVLNDTLSPYLLAGRKMFTTLCGSCHSYDKQLTGPAMKGLEGRGPWNIREELIKFTRSPAGYAAHNCYARTLIAQYGQTMPAYVGLSDKDLNAIYDYIRAEDIKRKLDLTNNYKVSPCEDSCFIYDSLQAVYYEKESLIQNRNELIDDNEDRVKYERWNSTGTEIMTNNRDNGTSPKVDPNSTSEGVNKTQKSEYYTFDIKSFGWYNIDKLIDEINTDNCRLSVGVDNSLTTEHNLFIAIPQYKMFDRGGLLDDNKRYGFYTKDGRLAVPLNTEVIVFDLTEKDGKVIYDFGVTKLTAVTELTLHPKAGTKEEFFSALSKYKLQKLNVEIKDSKNATEIRAIDEQLKKAKISEDLLEKFRPKNCDCSCGAPADSTAKTSK